MVWWAGRCCSSLRIAPCNYCKFPDRAHTGRQRALTSSAPQAALDLPLVSFFGHFFSSPKTWPSVWWLSFQRLNRPWLLIVCWKCSFLVINCWTLYTPLFSLQGSGKQRRQAQAEGHHFWVWRICMNGDGCIPEACVWRRCVSDNVLQCKYLNTFFTLRNSLTCIFFMLWINCSSSGVFFCFFYTFMVCYCYLLRGLVF